MNARRRASLVAGLVAGVVMMVGVALMAQGASVHTIASSLDIMKTMTIPFSDVVFKAGAEPPKTDQEWSAVRDQALALAEAGNLLMIGDRVKDKGAWMTMARAQVDAAEVAMKAAGAKNADGLSTAADTLYETCANCHKVYMSKK